jgi:isocitrate dehydrogenase (NAD+)
VTLIPGDGIGQEMSQSVKSIFQAAGVPVEWEQYNISGAQNDPVLKKQVLDSIRRNKVALKG